MSPENNIYFKNREVAAYRLLDVMPIDKMKLENWTVISSSCGGYEIAKVIADTLNAKLDIMINEKIEAPSNEECEIAIVTEHEEVVIHEELVKSFDISLDYIYAKSKQVYENIVLNKVNRLRHGSQIENLNYKNVLIVDEGINTGLTMMACIKTAINLGAKSISVATPILPTASIQTIESIADDLYYVKKLDHFISIDFYYDSLNDIEFEDLEKINKG
ncbi:phosphoribosyltransferase family protein [Arcobacter sp. YIC-464]|uniref:phosphoribosyltransferase family protein n=1 Tax=Arcobacter sp. YIC-464 TaxID=3376631 RepID=UPI003C2A622E